MTRRTQKHKYWTQDTMTPKTGHGYTLYIYIKIYLFKKLEVYTMYINLNIIQLKVDNDEINNEIINEL